ncbi:hypothetical protein ACFWIQ_36780 [Kitasatospora sp. NPDC127059]|uniref:hypothetical protein n=1 Tax=unclassified Kitasatospora TaxID=2633591 RepID=UPI003653F865
MLKESPHLAPWRAQAAIGPRPSPNAHQDRTLDAVMVHARTLDAVMVHARAL